MFLFDPDETGAEEFATSKKATELSEEDETTNIRCCSWKREAHGMHSSLI